MISKNLFFSKIFDEEREIFIYTPPGYNNSDNFEWRFPVIYMQDGQNLFSLVEEERSGKWNLEHTLNSMIESCIIEPVIIVGISHSDFRDDEYTPTFDNQELSGGLADLYLTFITSEVMPWIEKEYIVSPFREDTAICGSSLGGLLSLYAGIRYSKYFSMLGAMSPSLWWDDGVIFDMLHNKPLDPANTTIWLDMGHWEEEDDEESMDTIEESRELAGILDEQGFSEGLHYCYFEDAEGYHDETSWGKRMVHVLEFFFGLPEKQDFN